MSKKFTDDACARTTEYIEDGYEMPIGKVCEIIHEDENSGYCLVMITFGLIKLYRAVHRDSLEWVDPEREHGRPTQDVG